MRRTIVLGLAIAVLHAGSALARDPFVDEIDAGTPFPPPTPAPSVSPFVPPEDLYRVTDVYAGETVTTAGGTTTYATTTVREDPGTYARVLDVVGTGAASAFDGRSFNGRARLPDGRLVAGTYYEDFILTAAGFVSVNIVFFQDDAATRETGPVATAAPVPTPPAPATPATASPPPPSVPALPVATARPSLPVEPAPERTPIVATGVALAADGPILASVEILRGRLVHLWPRAFVDGAPASVRSWRLVSGAVDLLSRTTGGPSDACDAAWLRLPPPGTAAVLRFEITVDALGGRTLVATIAVTVRAPALVE